jgi:3-hydroxyisobutyrate dehydrogenase
MTTGDLSTPRLGLIGLGRMGMPMCERLVEAGFAVAAYDTRADLRSAARGIGAVWARSAGAAAEEADVMISVLPGPKEVSGAIAEITGHLRPGATWIDMSTASPRVASQVAAAGTGRGLRCLDAPVGGGPEAAREGRLLAFVGGDAADVEAQRKVLAVLADRVVHVGAGGAGYTVKLLVNLLWFGQAVASAEALALALKVGIDLDVLRDALGQSAAASRFLAEDADALLGGDDLTSFSLAGCLEELESVLGLGSDLDVPLDVGAVVKDIYRRALMHYGDVDGELLGARFVAERSGVSLHR